MIRNRDDKTIIKETKDYERYAEHLAVQKAGRILLKRSTADIDEKASILAQKLSSMKQKEER